uniref:myogenesis-regulating glycosidase-like n=1 Tax=Styela clava TaxID=7725 RepID=UPI001939F5B1|nr:myogenesis-regulating glycosidase-like [Styela clava]
MCLIIAGTVTYLTVKMTKAFPDKRIWALVAFTALTFFVGIITMSVGITLITKSKQAEDEATPMPTPTYSVLYDSSLLQLQYQYKMEKTVLSTHLAQAADGRRPLNYSFVSSEQGTNSESDQTVSLRFSSEENGDAQMTMTLKDLGMEGNVASYEVSWTSEAEWLEPTDCFSMSPYGDGWFGGSEMYYQWWPINRWSKEMSFYLSGDMYSDAQQYGSVLERYWLSATGAALYVDADVPLHVSTENYRLCFKGSFKNSPYRESATSSEGLPFLKYRVFLSPDARQTHEYVFLKSGLLKRPQQLPDRRMIKSPIWSTWARYKQNVTQDVVLGYANEIESKGFSNSQLEIDDGYETSYGDYTFDPVKFPDAAGMIEQLHNKGFRVTTWVTTFVNRRSVNYNETQYFVKNGEGDVGNVVWWDGVGALVDYTNPAACDWYVSNLEKVRQRYGVDSFKFDAGEINYLTSIPDYQTHEFLKNPGTYTTDYAACAHRLGDQIEVRASWRNQDLPIFVRMMDKDSNWTPAKGLKTMIPTALTFSLLGYPYILPDMIGGNGYENGFLQQYLPERELYIRWLEMTAFLPAMQFSISPWQFDDEVTELAKQYVEIHETTVYEELTKAFQEYIDGDTGMGAIRPIWWIAPTDKNSYQIDDEFLIGDRYLVAPIVENATRSRDVYLPGPSGSDGQPLMWMDRLREGGDPIKGGVTIKNYAVNLEEISWWELK